MQYYAGLDLGGTFVKGGIVDDKGNIVAKDKIPTGKDRPYTEIARDMAALVKSLAKKAGVAESDLKAVGIGSPGTIDSKNGVIVYSNNIRWENVPLASEIEKELSLPVSVTNDANAAALGESFAGAAKQYPSSIFVTLGTGVGGGIVIDGKLFEGNRSAGAEIGHMVIHTDGEPCTCGRKGCFEAYASASALVRQTKNAMICHPESKMWELCRGNADNADGRTAFDGMRKDDETAKEVVERYLNYLAEGIANIVNVFRPQAVLIGGGISAEGEALTLPLQKMVDTKILGHGRYAPVTIRAASLGNDAGLVGAAMLAKEIK